MGDVTASQFSVLVDRVTALEGEGPGVPGDGVKIVFVTSGAYAPVDAPDPDCSFSNPPDPFCVRQDGTFNSVMEADALCQGAAMSAGLTVGGEPLYLAWVSTAVDRDTSVATSPFLRFVYSEDPYVSTNPSGTVIANNWDDLIDGNLNFQIALPSITVALLPTSSHLTALKCENHRYSSVIGSS